jgi:hypothetical protein
MAERPEAEAEIPAEAPAEESAPPAPEPAEREPARTAPVRPATSRDAPAARDARAAFAALREGDRADALAAVARTALDRALHPDRAERVRQAAAAERLSGVDAATRWGNALSVLERGPEDAAERALSAALAALGLARRAKDEGFDAERTAREVFVLAARTDLDASALLDDALGDRAGAVWAAVAKLVQRFDIGEAGALDRGATLLATLALATSSSEAARRRREHLTDLSDPLLRAALGAATAGGDERFEGELAPAPRGPIATVLLAVTGLLLVTALLRVVTRWVLGLRRPAEVSVGPSGVIVRAKTILLGRTIREREFVLPREGIATATREVRFPSLGLYAGLLALALGSWVGAGVFTDGIRAASPSLLGTGLAVLLAGVLLDFVLATLVPGSRGRCRVLLRPRRGPTMCIASVEPKRADAALARLRG